jgi:Amino acid synthesis
MPDVQIRKLALALEEIWHEGGPPAAVPRRRAAVLAAIHNPFAGRYVADIQPFMEDLKPLGMMMAGRLLTALGGDAALIDGYGKGALIGEAGEVEHGALWHAPGGYAMRDVLCHCAVNQKGLRHRRQVGCTHYPYPGLVCPQPL